MCVIGERFDFILNANQPAHSYWIKTKGLNDCGVNKAHETGILIYNSQANKNQLPDSTYTYENITRFGLVFTQLAYVYYKDSFL